MKHLHNVLDGMANIFSGLSSRAYVRDSGGSAQDSKMLAGDVHVVGSGLRKQTVAPMPPVALFSNHRIADKESSIQEDRTSQRKLFWAAFWQGLGGSISLSAPRLAPSKKMPARKRVSDLEAMRSDWKRIGGDFAVAIKQEKDRN